MQLNTAQLQTLKQWVIDNANSAFDQSTANLLNALATPDFWVFRTSVTTDKAREALVWSEILTGSPLSVLKQWAFNTLTHNGDFNPSVENERVGFTSIFDGAAYAGTRANLLSASTRKSTLGEKLLSILGTGPGGGDGSAQAASAVLGSFVDADGNLVYAEGLVTSQNLIDAANS